MSIMYHKTELIGDTPNSLDGIDGAILIDGDLGIVQYLGTFYSYVLDADSGAVEDVPNVIVPDHNAGLKRWVRSVNIFKPNLGATYYPDHTAANQGVSGNSTFKSLVDLIGSDRATIILTHRKGEASTVYTFNTGITVPNNISVVVEEGAILYLNNITITCNGLFIAPRVKCIECVGSGILKFAMNCGMDSVYVEWYGTDHIALAKASQAARSAYLDITIGNSNIDIGNNIVIINNNYSNFKGCGCNRSRITVGATGSLQIKRGLEGFDLRGLGFEDIMITSPGTTNKVIEFVKDATEFAGSNVSFTRCRLSGGQYTVYSSGSFIGLTFDKSILANNGVNKYAIYIDAQSPPPTPYFNGLSIDNATRIEGNVYINMDRTFNMAGGSILETTDGTVALEIVKVSGGGIDNCYFEHEGQVPIKLGQNVHGFKIMGNMIDKGPGGTNHIQCDGTACIIGGNTFISISESIPQIHLQSNSKYCRVLENRGGDYNNLPRTLNDGVDNTVWGAVERQIWMTAVDFKPVESFEQQILVKNNGFEKAGIGTVFQNWDEYNVDANNYIADETSLIFEGDHSCKLVKTSGTGGGDVHFGQIIDVTGFPARRTLRLEFFVRTDGIHPPMYVIYDVTNATNIIGRTTTYSASTKYSYFKINFVRPTGCNQIRIEIWPDLADEPSTYYFDNIRLLEEREIVIARGACYYLLPRKGTDPKFYPNATFYEYMLKLPDNMINRNGTDRIELILETYFAGTIPYEGSGTYKVNLEWRIGELSVGDSTDPDDMVVTYLYTNMDVAEADYKKMLKGASSSFTISSPNTQFIRIRAGRGVDVGTPYWSDLKFFGVLARILHVTV